MWHSVIHKIVQWKKRKNQIIIFFTIEKLIIAFEYPTSKNFLLITERIQFKNKIFQNWSLTAPYRISLVFRGCDQAPDIFVYHVFILDHNNFLFDFRQIKTLSNSPLIFCSLIWFILFYQTGYWSTAMRCAIIHWNLSCVFSWLKSSWTTLPLFA